MDLNTIREIKRPASTEDVPLWREGYAWLAGGTWLFSEPQPALDTLIDLEALEWPALTVTPEGLEIAATCRIAELRRFSPPPDWRAAALIRECCDCLLMSFKITNEATVGGNICMSLPAGAMISLAASLEAVLTLWSRGGQRDVQAVDFVTGNHANILRPGELLRSIHIPARALTKRFAFRRASLTHYGRSAALIVGTQSAGSSDLTLTVSAATPRPVQFVFETVPSADELRRAIDERLPRDGYFDDVHGSAAYKRHLTYHFAEDIRAELAGPGARP